MAELCRKYGISAATFYKWRSKYGGLEVSEAKRLRSLEVENAKLKRLVAEMELEIKIRELSKEALKVAGEKAWKAVEKTTLYREFQAAFAEYNGCRIQSACDTLTAIAARETLPEKAAKIQRVKYGWEERLPLCRAAIHSQIDLSDRALYALNTKVQAVQGRLRQEVVQACRFTPRTKAFKFGRRDDDHSIFAANRHTLRLAGGSKANDIAEPRLGFSQLPAAKRFQTCLRSLTGLTHVTLFSHDQFSQPYRDEEPHSRPLLFIRTGMSGPSTTW